MAKLRDKFNNLGSESNSTFINTTRDIIVGFFTYYVVWFLSVNGTIFIIISLFLFRGNGYNTELNIFTFIDAIVIIFLYRKWYKNRPKILIELNDNSIKKNSEWDKL